MLLWTVFTQVLLPILVLVGTGWLLDRRCDLDLRTLVRLNLYLIVPAFIFHQIVTSSLSTGEAVRVALFTLCVVGAMFLASAIVGRLSGYSAERTRALQLATMFYNSGNYGVPLMALAFPGIGPLLQVFVILTQNISTFTIGLFLAASSQTSGWRAMLPMLRQVSVWAAILGLAVRGFHLPVEQVRWIWVPIEYLQQVLVGFALVTLGVQLSKARTQQHLPRLSWAIGLRLIGGPAVAALLAPLFGFTGLAAKILILSAGLPTAVNTALIAHELKADEEFATAAVFYSTIASAVTVTALIAILHAA